MKKLSHNLSLSIFKDNKLIHNMQLDPIENIEKYIWKLTEMNTFVFISKELYKSLNKNITEQIDSLSLEDIENNSTITLEDILNKKVVFVKYNNLSEISPILDMIKQETGNTIHIEMNELYVDFKY